MQLPPPLQYHKTYGVRVIDDQVEILNEPVYYGSNPRLTPVEPNGVEVTHTNEELLDSNVTPYLSLPDSFTGSQLKSYGGYIKYDVQFDGPGTPSSTPTIIIVGNGYTLVHNNRQEFEAGTSYPISARLFVGEWLSHKPNARPSLATRSEIMMVLAAVDKILIKLLYVDGKSMKN